MRKFIIYIIISLLLLTGCVTHRATSSSERVRTEYVHQTDTLLRHDSTYVHDSVFIAIHGDTIFKLKWRTEYRDRIVYRNHTDTVNHTDTIYRTEVKTAQITTPTSILQRITSVVGILAICLLAAIFLTLTLRRIIK